MLNSIFLYVFQGSLEESLLEIFVLSSVLQTVESALDSTLEESIKDLTNRSRTMSLGFMLSLSYRLASVMPMLIQIFMAGLKVMEM